MLEDKAAHFFKKANSRNFEKEYLLKVIERLYPSKPTNGSKSSHLGPRKST